MTDSAPQRRLPKARPWAVAAGASALFLLVLTVLAGQIRAGRDPALAAARPAPAPPALVRRVRRRVIVTHLRRIVVEPAAGAGVAGAPAGSGAPLPASTPAATPSAPAPAAPAASPAPTAAPAPAPVVTSAPAPTSRTS